LPRPRPGDEEAAARRTPAQERVLRHLRLSLPRYRADEQGDPGRQHPVRLGDARCGEGHRSGDRPQLRRHQALHRSAQDALRGRPPQDLRRQCPPRLPETGQTTKEKDMSASMRILEIPGRPDPRLVAEFAKMVTPHLSDSMERLYAGGPQLRPMHREGKLAGPAFTVKTAAGDDMLVKKAIDSSRPGGVVDVDVGGIITTRINT